MKYSVILTVIALLLGSCDSHHTTTINPELVMPQMPSSIRVKSTSKAIAYFRAHPFLMDNVTPERAAELTNQVLNHFENIIETAQQCDSVSLDFILMIHNDNPLRGTYNENSRFSQDETYRILKQNQYELIGFEGSRLEHMTLENFRKEITDGLQQKGIPLTGLEKLWPSMLENDAVLKFMKHFPTTNVAGIEMYPIDQIQYKMLFDGTMEDDVERFDMATDLRSELAVARIILISQKNKLQRAVVVIGASHGPHLVEIAASWGCGGSFYRALSEDEKQKPWHQLDGSRDN